jgi:hypothetical protein
MEKINPGKKKIKKSKSQLVKFFFEYRNDLRLMSPMILRKLRNDLESGEVNYFFGTVNNRSKIIS